MMHIAFVPPTIVAVGLCIIVAGCGGGGDTTTTTTTTTTPATFDSHVKWIAALKIDTTTLGVGPSVGADGIVFMPIENYLCALSGDDGMQQWQFRLNAKPDGVPVVGLDGSVYVQVGDALDAFDPAVQAVSANGTKKWCQDGSENSCQELQSSNTGLPPMLASGNAVGRHSMARGSDGTIFATLGISKCLLFAFDGDDGSIKWVLRDTTWQSSPVVAPDDTVFTVYDDALRCNIRAVHGVNGSEKWSVETPFTSTMVAPTLGANGSVLACSDGLLVAFDGKDGSVRWQHEDVCTLTTLSPPVGADGTVFVQASAGPILLALNGGDGSVKWKFYTSGRVGSVFTTAALSTDGTVYVGLDDRLYALEAESGTLLWNSTSSHFGFGQYSAPPVVGPDGTVFVVNDFSLVALHGNGGPIAPPYGSEYAWGVSLV